MKYVKPLQLFMETQKPCVPFNWLVVGLTSTARHLCWAVAGHPGYINLDDYYPHETKCIVEKLSSIQKEVNLYQDETDGEVIIGIVAGKNRVGPPMDLLIDELCKSGKFESLKYTYWVDNIVTANSEPFSKLYVNHYHEFLSSKSKEDDIDGVSALRMLQGYMDLCSTLVERPKRDCYWERPK